MRLAVAFLRLIRWPNLVFIALTQWLYYYAIILPLNKKGIGILFDTQLFILLIIALVRGNSGGSATTDKVTYTKTTERDV